MSNPRCPNRTVALRIMGATIIMLIKGTIGTTLSTSAQPQQSRQQRHQWQWFRPLRRPSRLLPQFDHNADPAYIEPHNFSKR
jgi:hypothetical protein